MDRIAATLPEQAIDRDRLNFFSPFENAPPNHLNQLCAPRDAPRVTDLARDLATPGRACHKSA
jgi:hypothetical protein